MDTFGDIVAGCRKLGMNVIARTDSHACHQDVYDAHPDWIAVDEYGNKRRHASDPEYWLTCALGPYNFDFMSPVHQEIIDRKSTRLNSSHLVISYAVFCLKKKNT